jgi:hypothetical protein
MKRLSRDIIGFFYEQGFVVVSTLDKQGSLHNSCKGIVNIDPKGRVYLLDLYRGRTYENLKRNSRISITAVDEHKFMGYCLKGKAREISGEELNPEVMQAWDQRIIHRLTRRLLKNLREEKGHRWHPEALLPRPEYMIVMQVEEIVDLTPHHLK